MTWKPGDIILAQKPPDPYFYPGVVRDNQDGRINVLFDDGAEARLRLDQTLELKLEPGDQVQVRVPLGREYTPARVLRWNGQMVTVELAEGDQETTSPGMIRIDRAAWKVDGGQRPRSPWIVGDRVWGLWGGDRSWYPGTIQEIQADLHILFDDGDREWLPADKVRKLEVSLAQKLECRLHRGPIFLPGKILQVDGERIVIRYDDSQEESSVLSMCRIVPKGNTAGSAGHTAVSLQPGQRVFSVWYDGLIYPATIAGFQNDLVTIHYDDGDVAQIPPNQVFPLRVKVGWRVQASKNANKQYMSGRISQVNGEDLLVEFDDGTKAWVKLAGVRIHPQDMTR